MGVERDHDNPGTPWRYESAKASPAIAGIGLLCLLVSTLLSACSDRPEATATLQPISTLAPPATSIPTPLPPTSTPTPAPTHTPEPTPPTPASTPDACSHAHARVYSTDAYFHADTYSHAHARAYYSTDAYFHADAYSHTHARAYSHTDARTYPHTDRYAGSACVRRHA